MSTPRVESKGEMFTRMASRCSASAACANRAIAIEGNEAAAADQRTCTAMANASASIQLLKEWAAENDYTFEEDE